MKTVTSAGETSLEDVPVRDEFLHVKAVRGYRLGDAPRAVVRGHAGRDDRRGLGAGRRGRLGDPRQACRSGRGRVPGDDERRRVGARPARGRWLEVQIADARKAKAVGSLAAKTDKLDARVLAELARRDLVPEVHVPTFADRELKERLGRRMHLVRLRTAAMNRAHGVLSQFGVTLAFKRLREPDVEQLLVERGIPEVWRRSIAEAVAVVAMLDQRLIPLEQELRPLARADPRVALLVTIPGVGDLLALTIASEVGEISRFASARKLIGYSGLTPRVYQSQQKARTGKLSKSGSAVLRWAAIEAAQQAWRPNNPWHQLYLDVKQRCGGKGNPAKAAVARKVLIASWHVLALQQPFNPSRPRGADAPVPASSSCVLAA